MEDSEKESEKTAKKRKTAPRKRKTKAAKRRAPPKPTFPAAEIHFLLAKGKLKNAVKPEVSLYLSAAEEYLATEILEKAGNHAITNGRASIDVEDVIAAIKEDDELNELLGDFVDETISTAATKKKK